MQLIWTTHREASWFHAAAALARGDTLVDTTLAEALVGPAAQLTMVVKTGGIVPTAFYNHLVPLAVTSSNHRELAKVALTKVTGAGRAEVLLDSVARYLIALIRAGEAAQPDLAEQLLLRALPLTDQWDARGPGLLAAIGRRTEPELLAERAEIILVHPSLGGYGQAYLTYNRVVMEGMLANPHPALPEVLRLGWLLSTLQTDLPIYTERLPRERATQIALLAFVPATLAAGQEVELTTLTQANVEEALVAWRLTAEPTPGIADALLRWWEIYESSSPSWAVALVALDKLLQAEGEPAA